MYPFITLHHLTRIHKGRCIVEDGIYKVVVYDLISMDISMRYEKDPKVMTRLTLELPPPDMNKFIPYEEVDERTILKWIADHEPNMVELQRLNTQKLLPVIKRWSYQAKEK